MVKAVTQMNQETVSVKNPYIRIITVVVLRHGPEVDTQMEILVDVKRSEKEMSIHTMYRHFSFFCGIYNLFILKCGNIYIN